MTDVETVFKYLILGAEMNKQVEIFYRHMYPNERRHQGKPVSRFGCIQPIKWQKGKEKNTLLILTWDCENEGWRRFNVENIERVQLTDRDWVKEISHEITQIPL